jgi:flagellar basal-body rod modification protein FlgD
MTVSAVDSTTSSPTSQAQSKATVDYDSFLRLLVAELKNQDPTKPMDSTDFVAQLATFSQVEQTIQTNTKLDQMLQSNALAQADSLIGREITTADGKTTGVVAEVKITSGGITAVLENGTQVAVGDGITIRAAD